MYPQYWLPQTQLNVTDIAILQEALGERRRVIDGQGNSPHKAVGQKQTGLTARSGQPPQYTEPLQDINDRSPQYTKPPDIIIKDGDSRFTFYTQDAQAVSKV